MKKGFIIEELKLTGETVSSATIEFKEGFNIITGPSNTGKSYIFQCLNYMFGSSSSPKAIKEADGYSKIYLKIRSLDGENYLLETDLKGGDFWLYSSDSSSQRKKLSRKHSPTSEETISSFFLKLNGIEGKKIRTNAKGKTRDISYRDIVKFLLVDETRITTDSSPILSGQYVSKTAEENVFQFILTGQDDSDVIEQLNEKEITNRRGRIELLAELIVGSTIEIDSLGETDDDEQLLRVNESIASMEAIYEDLNTKFSILDKRKVLKLKEKSELISNSLYTDELIKRSLILKDQYVTDSNRLKSTIEASYLFIESPEVLSSCPICNNEIRNNQPDVDIADVVQSCTAEINKISSLQMELLESQKIFSEEKEKFTIDIQSVESEIEEIESEIGNTISNRLDEIIIQLKDLNNKKINLLHIAQLKNIRQAYQEQKTQIEDVIKAVSQKVDLPTVSTATVTSLSSIIKEILEKCSYPKLSTVSYSEERKDFVISGEDRNLAGKGYRAITYAAFIIGLQELVFNTETSLGTPVLDSPLVTYRKPNNENEEIPVDLAMDFYRYVANNRKITQCIILENEEPPIDIKHLINHIEFSGSETTGRYGYFPIKQ